MKSLKTTIKVGKRKVRLDDMDHPATAKLISLLNLHAERLNNMYAMGKVRKELYDVMK
jgi:hypothetical protein